MLNSLMDVMQERLRRGLGKAKQLGASGAKLGFHHEERIASEFENGRLKEAGYREALSYSIEVLANGRRGRTSGNDLEAMDELVGRAMALAEVGSVAHFDAYPGPGTITSVKSHSDRTLALTREEMIAGCQQFVDAIKQYSPDLYILCGADRVESEGLLMTSGGVSHPFQRTHWSLGGEVQRTEDTDILFAGYGRSWCDLNDFYDPDAIADRVVTDVRQAEKTVEPPEGRGTVVLPPEAVGHFLSPILMGINGRNVAKGDSPLAGRLGEQVLAPCLTVIDDPHVDYATGSAEVDGDGVPARKLSLFENGVLQRFLYDLDSAGLAGAEPTGNSGCSPHNVVVSRGTRSSQELLAEVRDGIFVRNVVGFGQSNVMNGDFSCNVSLGYRIQNGELVGRIKNTMIAGNLYELLKQDVELSSDLDHEGRFPYAVVRGANVSAARG